MYYRTITLTAPTRERPSVWTQAGTSIEISGLVPLHERHSHFVSIRLYVALYRNFCHRRQSFAPLSVHNNDPCGYEKTDDPLRQHDGHSY